MGFEPILRKSRRAGVGFFTNVGIRIRTVAEKVRDDTLTGTDLAKSVAGIWIAGLDALSEAVTDENTIPTLAFEMPAKGTVAVTLRVALHLALTGALVPTVTDLVGTGGNAIGAATIGIARVADEPTELDVTIQGLNSAVGAGYYHGLIHDGPKPLATVVVVAT